MDLRMPGTDGITATERILRARSAVRVVVPTTFDDDDHLYPALAAGAHAFLARDATPAELLDAIRQARQPVQPGHPAPAGASGDQLTGEHPSRPETQAHATGTGRGPCG